jgi:hypothetical protein
MNSSIEPVRRHSPTIPWHAEIPEFENRDAYHTTYLKVVNQNGDEVKIKARKVANDVTFYFNLLRSLRHPLMMSVGRLEFNVPQLHPSNRAEGPFGRRKNPLAVNTHIHKQLSANSCRRDSVKRQQKIARGLAEYCPQTFIRGLFCWMSSALDVQREKWSVAFMLNLVPRKLP